MAVTADKDSRALLQRIVDVLFDFGYRLVVDQRTLRRARLESVRGLQLLHRRRQLRRERVVDTVLHVDAVDADARLPGVAVLRRHRALDRSVEIGIVEDDEWRVAAELE